MVSQKTAEELPPGWKEYVKVKNGRKIKYFTNLATGEKLYSKKGVFRAQSLEISEGNSPACNPDNESVACKSKASTSQDDVKANDSPEWLPHGWTVESRARRSRLGSGAIYKIYIEPLTGSKFYSKPQVMRYLQGLEDKNDGGRQQEQISEKTPPKRQVLFPSVEGKIILSGENKNVAAEPYSKVVCSVMKDKDGLDELPSRYRKEINTRKRALEKRNASLLSESLGYKNHIPGENENDLAKPLKMDTSDVQQKNGLDELPPGWIKVSKARKSSRGMRADPYYIEITSGYAFRSKKDAMRYLDTGDINSCAIKPHKWDSSELKQKEDTHCSTPYPGNEAGESVARQPFIGQEPEYGKESSQVSNIVVAEAENPRDKDKLKVKNVPALATKLTASSTVDTHLGSGATDGEKSRESSRLKVEGSEQDIKIVHGNMAVGGTETAGFNDQKMTENCLDLKTKTDLRKPKKRKPPSTPGRSSKRLAGHEPEMRPNFSLTERALRAAIKKPHEKGVDRTLSKAMDTATNAAALQQPVTQATTSPNLVLNTAADQGSQQPVNELETSRSSNLATSAVANKISLHPVVTEAETTVVHRTSVSAEAYLETGLQNDFKMQSDNQMLQETTGLLSEKQVEENTMPQVDYWSDPCWDFAFKTLTGAIPLEETLPGCFPQPTGTSYTQENLTFGLPEFEMPPVFQNDVQQTAPVQNNVPVNQLSTNSTLPTAGNINLPGCSSQPSLEAQSKDYQTKVKS